MKFGVTMFPTELRDRPRGTGQEVLPLLDRYAELVKSFA